MRPKCNTNKEPPTENKITPKTRRCAQAVWDPVQDTTAHTQPDGKAGEKLLSGLQKIKIVFVQISIFETFLVERFSRANFNFWNVFCWKVFSCKCPTLAEGERVGRQTFRDQDKADFDRRCDQLLLGGILRHFDKPSIFTPFQSGFTLTIKEIWLPNGTAHFTVYTRPLGEYRWQYFSKVS